MYVPSASELKHYLIDRNISIRQYSEWSGVDRYHIEKLIKQFEIPVPKWVPMPDRSDFLEQFDRLGKGIDVAAHYGVSPATVTKWCRVMEVNVGDYKRPSEDKRPTDEQLYVWYELEKKSLDKIAKMLKVDREVLRTWMDDAEIERRPTNYRTLDINELELADDLAQGELKYTEIARKHGISDSTLLRFREKYDFPIKRKPE
ncbi:hypothetical protein ADM98_11550 [Exiguobacterium sp. BMC-KP]|uniref:hypothetical protein n=1 Tax=Exiguobacterium sp. BMC-KP TaxID=1684312 RepID=UPI0006AA30A3|nr:hypothetical protein [Exiguobacterium sp. BMC-KP]KOP29498.1 hypothetical protein ADM98_11550 [Exiguobacterium sp. BMC-KP]